MEPNFVPTDLLTRRRLLCDCALGAGSIALMSLLARESQAQFAAAAIRELQSAFVQILQQAVDGFAQFCSIVHRGRQMHFDLRAGPAQDAGALAQFTKVVVVIAVVVVGGFEGREGAVKQIAGGDLDRVHQRFVTSVQADHALFHELIDP